jgi:cytochrome bd-type quinol oxidase subunit 2
VKATAVLLILFALSAVSKLDPFPERNSAFDVTMKAMILAQLSAIAALWLYIKSRDRKLEKLWARVARLHAFALLIKACNLVHCPFRNVELDDETDKKKDD